MGDEPKGAKKRGTGKGDFFKVDRKGWEAATGLGLNPAVAYLVLARFTDRSNQFTAASVHAVEKHTGISRGRAKKAVEALLAKDLLRRVNAEDAVRPRYEFVISSDTSEDGRIWLPNSIVTGAANETAPVEALRKTQDPLVLRLFVDLYRVQNLRESEGIDRKVLWQKHERTPVGQAAQYQLWSFSDGSPWVAWNNDVTPPHLIRFGGEQAGEDFFRRLRTLTALGLIEWIPHLFESDGPEAEAIHACGRGQTESLEDRLGNAAHEAAEALLGKFRPEAVLNEEHPWMVPVPKHLVNVQMIGVARLRYRPRTALTSTWWHEVHEKGEAFLAQYKSIVDRA